MAGYRIYEAFEDDAAFFGKNLKSGLAIPVMAICGEASIADSLEATKTDLGA